jgi:hypothetical protein
MSNVLYVPMWRCRDLTEREVKGIGVDPCKLAGDDRRGLFKVTAARVVWGEYASFDFATEADEDGVNAVVFVCRDQTGHVADMAAWSPRDNYLGTWGRRVTMLGEENALLPRLGGEALAVWPSPKAWLNADREGVVIIDAAAALSTLYAASPIQVSSRKMRAELFDQWKPKMPEVRCT